ncbi:MAG: hypothetical protein ACRC54_02255 [Fusobacteriaceae bacterium]
MDSRIAIILLVIMIISFILNFFHNQDLKYKSRENLNNIEKESISKEKNRDNFKIEEIDREDFLLLKKIYRKLFKDKKLYTLEGIVEVKYRKITGQYGMTYEYPDYYLNECKVISCYSEGLVKDEYKILRGVIYDGVFYAVEIDGINVLEEIKKIEKLPKIKGEYVNFDIFLIFLIPLIFIFLLSDFWNSLNYYTFYMILSVIVIKLILEKLYNFKYNYLYNIQGEYIEKTKQGGFIQGIYVKNNYDCNLENKKEYKILGRFNLFKKQIGVNPLYIDEIKIEKIKSKKIKEIFLMFSFISLIFIGGKFIIFLNSDYYKAHKFGIGELISLDESFNYGKNDFKVGQELKLNEVRMIYEPDEKLYYVIKEKIDNDDFFRIRRLIEYLELPYKESDTGVRYLELEDFEKSFPQEVNTLKSEREKIKKTAILKLNIIEKEVDKYRYFPSINEVLIWKKGLEKYLNGTEISVKGTIVKINNINSNIEVISLDKDKGFLDKTKIEKVPGAIKKIGILFFIFSYLFIKGIFYITRKNKKLLGIQGD